MKIGLIGNPNVGKSTIFNALTGLREHTGNWTGKTVEKTFGFLSYKGVRYQIEDLPGTYSLYSHSKEEEITRDYVYFGDYDYLVIVCDACALERNLNLVIQVLEVTNKVIVCVNLIDEAKRKNIDINIDKLSELLGVNVVSTNARDKKGIYNIFDNLKCGSFNLVDYDFLEDYILYDDVIECDINKKSIGIHLLLKDYWFIDKFNEKYNCKLKGNNGLELLYKKGFNKDDIETIILECISDKCFNICKESVTYNDLDYDKRSRIIDSFLTNKFTGCLAMIILLFLILWITIVFANYPSDFLYNLFFKCEVYFSDFLKFIHLPNIIIDILINGVYKVLAWVVSVMLPPMMIFFPLFSILEDLGYLPRIAFNLDGVFKKCGSCGKQSLTMMEGFGCNAVGVMGSRIIDSPRERLISIITNSFIPCNGRFPLMITMITMFLTGNMIFGSLILTMFILFSFLMTFLISKILSKTILKGFSSSFILELPSYRRPKYLKVIIRSIIDKVLVILKRTILVSLISGLIIWLFANVKVGNVSLFKWLSCFLDPFGKFIGLDGIILMAFMFGLPANEIVIPIMLMGYMSLGSITDYSNLQDLKNLLVSNGWNYVTSLCVIMFSMFHFPCMTTLLTIKKETNNKWMFLSFLIPLLVGIIVCFCVNSIFSI